MNYTPTEQELIEMGFVKDGLLWEKKFRHTLCYISGDEQFENGFYLRTFRTELNIYPRSREHLEQVILAFTK